jgi:hypothetical protein
MAQPIQVFQNYSFAQTFRDEGRSISFTQNWLGILIQVTEFKAGTGSVRFYVEWSDDGNVWGQASQESAVAVVTGTGTFIKSMQIQACFWRIGAEVTHGPNVGITCSATALV